VTTRRAGAWGALGVLLLARPAGAAPNDPTEAAACAAPAAAPGAARRWAAPLDRVVTLPARESTLRDALDRLAAAGRFRLSYAAELLPLDRRVCPPSAALAAGDALVALVGDAAVEPVVVDADQVVLAPARPAADRTEPAGRTTSVPPGGAARSVGHLERVLVTESVDADRGAAVKREVFDGATLEAQGGSDAIAAALAATPGVWVWSQSPTSLLAQYGSLRGASSFGVSAPKIYVDGIEAANPLLVAGIAPETVDSVTVLRGPQGAALYGADAIGGVIEVTTRHDGVAADAPRFQIRSDVGPTRSDFGPDVLGQRHSLALRTGTPTRSAGLAVSLASLGDFVPNGSSREASAHGDARVIGRFGALALTARLFDKSAGASPSPLLAGLASSALQRPTGSGSIVTTWRGRGEPSGAAYGTTATTAATTTASPTAARLVLDSTSLQSVREYTLGATATLASVGRWTPQAVVGVDGYRLSGPAAIGTPFASASDSALRAARGGADRVTARVSSVGRFGTDSTGATVTLLAEHSTLRDATWSGEDPVAAAWRSSTGLVAQTRVAYHDALFVSGGVRLERDAGYATTSTLAALPSLGASLVRPLDALGGATLTLRAAYGRAIRPARTGYGTSSVSIFGLAPETQAGVESGVDLAWGSAFALHATHFDQRVTNLVQPVLALGVPVAGAAAGLDATRRVVLVNAGEIANRGWELAGSAAAATPAGRLSLGGALSLVDSRVARVAACAVTGSALRVGDRMLDVPARTATLSLGWTAPRWSASTGLAHASDWVDYDRLALTRDLLSGAVTQPVAGSRLLAYRRTYDGVTRLRASASRELPHGFALTLAGDNLLDQQRGEPDDATVVPGRSITFGVRAKF
jgi:iron complex outermembrane receptor protein